MKVRHAPTLQTLSGHSKGSYLIMYERAGIPVARAYVKPRNRRSRDQKLTRAYHAAAARHWRTLTPDQFLA
jgi:hypothetical protein